MLLIEVCTLIFLLTDVNKGGQMTLYIRKTHFLCLFLFLFFNVIQKFIS